MLDRKVFFLSGLPRTGSTLLGSILAQNPDLYVTPTSPLYELLVRTNEHLNELNLQYTFDQLTTGGHIYHALVAAYYANIKAPVIFDKHRGWPKHVPAIKAYLNAEPKIVCTIRPIAEVITSYLVLVERDPNNFIDKHLRLLNQPLNHEARANLLWSTYLKTPYESLTEGIKLYRDALLLVDYRDIVEAPRTTLDRIYEFCGLKRFAHYYSHIENRCAEAKDEAWGLKDLHHIRPTLQIRSADPRHYLPLKALQYFEQFDIKKAVPQLMTTR